jgi:hypothetical protein
MQIKPKSSVVNKNINDLKKNILESIFTGKSSPSFDKVINFPDLQFFLGQPNQYLIDDELTDSILIPQTNKNLEILSMVELKKLTSMQNKTAFFQFDIVEKSAKNLKIKLDLNMMGSDIKSVSPISTLLLNFKKNKNDWDLVDGPISLSS